MFVVLDGHFLSEMDCVNNLFTNIDMIREAVFPHTSHPHAANFPN